MGHRLSSITTRKGDDGTTVLGDGSRVPKDNIRIDAMGTVDELNSHVGLLISELEDGDEFRSLLIGIQNDLFDLGGEISIPGHCIISEDHILDLERNIEELNNLLPPLKNFVLPGGNKSSAQCQVVRSICRRSERELTSFAGTCDTNKWSLIYLNRLSDLLFVMGRILVRRDGGQEILWQQKKTDKS